MSHCEWAFSRYGDLAYSWLLDREHFERWLGFINSAQKNDSAAHQLAVNESVAIKRKREDQDKLILH